MNWSPGIRKTGRNLVTIAFRNCGLHPKKGPRSLPTPLLQHFKRVGLKRALATLTSSDRGSFSAADDFL